MLDKMVITKENGETVNADFISCFRTNVGGRDAVFYLTTINEVDPNGLYKIQASELVGGKLQTIASDSDWTEVKNIMRAIISGSQANFTYLEKTNNLSATNDYGRIIAVQLPAKDKMAADYKEKLPQATIDSIIGEAKSASEEAPLNTPDVAGGSVVAPGIVETPEVDTMDMPAAPGVGTAPSPEVTTPISPTLDPPVINPEPASASVSPLDSAANMVSPIETPTVAPSVAETPAVLETPVLETVNPDLNNPTSVPVSEVASPVSESVAPVNPVPTAVNEVVSPTPSESLSVNAADLEKEMESVILEAQNIFLESAKNLANKIIAEAIQKVKDKTNN